MALNFANNNSLSAITSKPSGLSGGAMTLLSTQTASASATIDFTTGIDSTYDEYVFKFYDIHPATDEAHLTFQTDTGTNTSYNQTLTSTFFEAYHNEADSAAALGYNTNHDLAQSTSFQRIGNGIGNGNDESGAGTLHLFSPSSSVFVKHFISNVHTYNEADMAVNCFCAGYFNTTTALTRVQFKMSSGNIDSGVIKLYGIS
jgi:hypothetical protein